MSQFKSDRVAAITIAGELDDRQAERQRFAKALAAPKRTVRPVRKTLLQRLLSLFR